jgi:hypothetical protein
MVHAYISQFLTNMCSFSSPPVGSETWTMKASDKPRKLLKLMKNCVTDYSVIASLTLSLCSYLFAKM